MKGKTMTQKKPLDKMSNNELTEYWNNRISKLLVGKRIIKVEYMSEKDAKNLGIDFRPIQIGLDNGVWLTPMRDDEGNDGGAIHTNIKSDGIIPVMC